jgi:hypothetical protein
MLNNVIVGRCRFLIVMLNLFQHPSCYIYNNLLLFLERSQNKFGMTLWYFNFRAELLFPNRHPKVIKP